MSDGFTPASAPAAFFLAARLVKCAARGAPPVLAERLKEEWLADLAAQRSAFAGLSFALGCSWATRVIAREHRDVSARVATSSTAGSRTLAIDFWSRSMTRFRSLWIAVAALAVTALLIFAAGEFAERAFSFVLRHDAYFANPWWSLAVSLGSVLLAIAVSLRQKRVHPRYAGGPGLPESRPRGAFWFRALVIFANSALLFAASVWFGFTTMHALPGSEMRTVGWGVALFLAAGGVGLLMLIPTLLSRPRSP
jgi:hypothetical protein